MGIESEREEYEREVRIKQEALERTESEREERAREKERFDESGLGPPDPGHPE